MADENMRLAAEVVDKFSGPIKKMQAELREVQKLFTGASKTGRDDAKAHGQALFGMTKQLREATKGVKQGLAPAIEELGLGALGATASLAGLAKASIDFANSAQKWKLLSDEVGITVNQLREFESLGPRIGATPEAMDSSWRNFATTMAQIRRGTSEALPWLYKQGEGAAELADKLRGETSNWAALKDVFDAMGRVQNLDKPQQQRALLGQLGLDPDLARLDPTKLQAMLLQIAKDRGELSQKQIDYGNAAAQSFNRLKDAAAGLRDEIGSDLAPTFTQFSDDLRNFLIRNRPEIDTFFTTAGRDIRTVTTSVENAVQTFGGWQTILLELTAIKLVPWLDGATGALGRLFGLTAPSWLLPLTGTIAALGAAKHVLEEHGVPDKAQPDADQNARADLQNQLGDVGRRLAGGNNPPPMPQAPTTGPGYHLEAYHPGADGDARLIRSAYTPGGDSAVSGMMRGFQEAVARGAEAGVYAGLWDFTRSGTADGAPGATPASLGPRGAPGGSDSAPGNAAEPSLARRFGAPPSGFEASNALSSAKDPELEGKIRDYAKKWGIDPDTAMRVARSEGFPWKVGDNGTSGGAFQLHEGGRGSVGTEYERATGHSVFDRRYLDDYLNFTFAWIRQHGWDAWSGARRQGIFGFRGVGPKPNQEDLHRAREALRRGIDQERAARHHDLLPNAIRAGLWPVGPQKVEGDAALHVKFDNMPRGTRVASSFSGLFKTIKIERGQAALADRDA